MRRKYVKNLLSRGCNGNVGSQYRDSASNKERLNAQQDHRRRRSSSPRDHVVQHRHADPSNGRWWCNHLPVWAPRNCRRNGCRSWWVGVVRRRRRCSSSAPVLRWFKCRPLRQGRRGDLIPSVQQPVPSAPVHLSSLGAVLLDRPVKASIKSAGRHVRPAFVFCFAVFTAAYSFDAADAQISERPVVVAQQFDDDCGLAALRMLLQRSGIEVAESALAASLPPSQSLDALSASDLAMMVENLGLGLRLDVLFLPVSAIEQFSEFEPFIILLKPQPLSGSAVFNHFVLVEARTDNGYLVADPILGERVELSDRDLAERTHGREVGGDLNPMILRLTRSGRGSGVVVPVISTDQRLMDWEAAYRQPRLLPQGKTQLSFGFSVQSERFRPEGGVLLGETNRELSLGFTHGLSGRTQFGLSLSFSDGSGLIQLRDDRTSFDLGEVRAVTLSFQHVPRIELPTGLGLVTSAELTWTDGTQPLYATLGADLSYVYNDFTFGLGTEMLYNGSSYWQVTPSARYSTVLADTFLLDLSLAAPFDVTFGTHAYEAELGLSRNFGPDLLLRGFINYGLSDDRTSERVGAGLEIVYGIPRRFRNTD